MENDKSVSFADFNVSLSSSYEDSFKEEFDWIADSVSIKVYNKLDGQNKRYISGFISLNKNWLTSDSLYKRILMGTEDVLMLTSPIDTFAADINFKYQENSNSILREAHFEYKRP